VQAAKLSWKPPVAHFFVVMIMTVKGLHFLIKMLIFTAAGQYKAIVNEVNVNLSRQPRHGCGGT